MRSQLPCVVCTALLFLVPCVAKAQREASGVGLTLGKHEGGFLVMQVLTNSPASLDGSIKAGDLITAVAQSNGPPVSLEHVEHIQEAVAMIRGAKGSLVRLTVVPDATNAAQAKVVTLARGELRGIPFA